MTRTTCLCLAAISSLAWPGLAAADVVDPVPEGFRCPSGTQAYPTHSGARCAVRSCDQGCPAGHECKPIKVCVFVEEYWKQGRTRMEREVISGFCESAANCPGGQCLEKRACVSGNTPPAAPREVARPSPPDVGVSAAAPPPPKGSFCAAGTGGLTPWLALFFLPALLRRRSAP